MIWGSFAIARGVDCNDHFDQLCYTVGDITAGFIRCSAFTVLGTVDYALKTPCRLRATVHQDGEFLEIPICLKSRYSIKQNKRQCDG